MSRLPRVSGIECRKALEKSGFVFKRQRGSHMSLVRSAPFALVSVPVHRELDPGTLRAILRHAGLSVEEFHKLLRGERSLAAESGAADPSNLHRFVAAQDAVFDTVLVELRAGKKRSHWMWFVFPQVEGLGFSSTSRKFAIRSPEEAEAYLVHPVLGPRLRKCTRLVVQSGKLSSEVFGYPDDLKFRSCMTLFARVSSEPELFVEALDKCCSGLDDPVTVETMKAWRRS